MNISKALNGSELTLKLDGRLDTLTAPDLESALADGLDSVDRLIFDFSSLEYISSAGLRVLLKLHKAMRAKRGMQIRHVNDVVREVFDITGFADILDIA